MRKLFCFGIILTLVLSIVSSYGVQYENGYNEIINAFEKTNAKFETYNINGHALMSNKFLSFDDMEKIVNQISEELGLNMEDFDQVKTNEDNFRQVYIYGKKPSANGIFIKIESERCENIEETHIIVDMNKNAVYKDIVDNYANVKNILSGYSTSIDIYSCITGSFEGMIKNDYYDKIVKDVFSSMKAKERERIEDKNLLSVTGYTNMVQDYIKYNSQKVNLNVSLRYSEYDDKTFIYIGTPLIVLEY